MQFPEGFVEKYEEILGDEARDFLASFEEEAVSAFRVNPLKEAPVSFPDAMETFLEDMAKKGWFLLFPVFLSV